MEDPFDLLSKSKKTTVYWMNTVSNDECVFKLTPEGDTYTKFKSEIEFKSNGSNIADQSRLFDLKEITDRNTIIIRFE